MTRSSRLVSRRRVLALLGTVPLVLVGCGGSDKKLSGTDLKMEPAPDFTLSDHRGEQIQLSALQGMAVVLTFIYTSCPDVCPATALNIRSTYDLLSEDVRTKVVFLAVTVDPEIDSAETLRAFSERFDLDAVPQWHAFPGERAVLEPVWAAYGIDPGAVTDEVESHASGRGRPSLLSHTDAVYVIDPKGRERVFMRSSFEPKEMASNLEVLVS